MTGRHRLNLSFSTASPLQCEAWELLCAVPAGQRTGAVCRAVCQMRERDALLEAVRRVVREELHGMGSITKERKAEQPQAGDVDENVLGFLFALQNDGGDE